MNSISRSFDLPGYELTGLLGSGGMASVFRARQNSTGQWVAIKLLQLDPDAAGSLSAPRLTRFDRETALCARLHHPHIVRLLDKGTLNRHLYYAVYEYLPGETLREYILRQGALSAAEATQIMLQVLDALACAHAQGIVHRDLKPQNIMIDAANARPSATLFDFGIGLALDDVPAPLDATDITGTPSYSAPEQLRGEPATAKTDLYAWGLLFIECLTGRSAFHGATLAEIYHAQLTPQDLPLPPGLAGHPLQEVLRAALAKQPRIRAGDAIGLYQRLASVNVDNLLRPMTLAEHDQPAAPDHERTWINPSSPSRAPFEKRQVTALYCSLSLGRTGSTTIDLETLEALQREHLSTSLDIVQRLGGHAMGALAAAMLFYFGYPRVSDRSGQHAARAALELIGQTRRRAQALRAQHGVVLEMSIAIHVGDVLLCADMQPSQTAARAQELQRRAAPGQIRLSQDARLALARFVECSQVMPQMASDAPTYLLVREHASDGFSFLDHGIEAMAGRQVELQALQALWRNTLADGGRAMLLCGEAGVGKSRLLFEWAALDDGLILSSLCEPEQQHAALYPVLRWVRQYLERGTSAQPQDRVQRLHRHLEELGLDADHLSVLLCSWLGIGGAPQRPGFWEKHSPELQKQMLLDALERLLLSIGERQPLRLLLEDTHWIDPSSAAFLDQLLPKLQGTAICLVMTARTEESPWIPRVPSLPLSGLDRATLEQLLSPLLGGRQIDAQALHSIHEHTAGIPLYVQELVAFLRSRGDLVLNGDTYQLATAHLRELLPVSLRETLGHSLHRVGAAKHTAQLAAALGREFDPELLAQIAPCDDVTLHAHLQTLLSVGLVSRCRQVGDAHYIFKHALLRTAAYDSMPRAAREQAHGRIAAALEARLCASGQGEQGVLAHHHAAAAQYEQALHWSGQATEQALQRALYDAALDLIAEAEPWLEQLPRSRRQGPELRLYRLKISALMARHGWANERVRNTANRAHQLALRSTNAEHTPALLWSLATYHHVASHRREVRQIVAQLYNRQSASSEERIAALVLAGSAAWIDGHYGLAREHLQQAVALPRSSQRVEQTLLYGLDCGIWAQSVLACVTWFTHTDDSLAHGLAADAVRQARELDHVPSLGLALMYQAYIHQYAGDLQQTAQVCGQLVELATTYGLPAYGAYGELIQSWTQASFARASRTIDQLRQLGCLLGHTYFHGLMADIQSHQGHQAEALSLCNSSLALCDELGERYYQPELLRLKARVLSRQGAQRNATEIADTLQQACALAEQMQMSRSRRDAQKDMSNLFH
ncbi:TOMM system kinase/cyclase fusion protein [Pseudomonas sp. TH05]|uniref:TOMM system kinase/cyclase fusion protein n=1 Tax=unclassified Pseudomonas TaxID=196821 RepID=UPI001913D1D8|nr:MULTISPECIES: TOMM system kinase/cyclase fusion protein [unclassified Pseudomonas]MBK5540712.1 TOMM system kinase/cyclase fusion protein [Pseudomonas sp. TH07]MBK5557134.1 TOMM system kinase/cyclase fusion protein [Pseudomonas sp. TH05]